MILRRIYLFFFSYIFPLFLLKFLPSFEYEINVRKYFYENKFDWSTLFQEMTSRINYSFIPIFSLFFITTPRAFGNFFGYLACWFFILQILQRRA